jgi:thymidine kinase
MAKLYFSYAATALYAEDGAGRIVSRLGVEAEAELFAQGDDLFALIRAQNAAAGVHCVLVDEAQFLTHAQVWQLARVADRLNIPVMCFGLRTDFQGKLFPGSSELLAVADVLREIRTICHCGAKATMVVRQSRDGRVLLEGDQVSIEKSVYVSLCRRHWEEATGRWPGH